MLFAECQWLQALLLFTITFWKNKFWKDIPSTLKIFNWQYSYMRQERLEGLRKRSFTFANQYCFSYQTQAFTAYKGLATVSTSLVKGCCRLCRIFLYLFSFLIANPEYLLLPAPFTIWPKYQEKATWMDRVKFATFKKFSCLHWWFFA